MKGDEKQSRRKEKGFKGRESEGGGEFKKEGERGRWEVKGGGKHSTRKILRMERRKATGKRKIKEGEGANEATVHKEPGMRTCGRWGRESEDKRAERRRERKRRKGERQQIEEREGDIEGRGMTRERATERKEVKGDGRGMWMNGENMEKWGSRAKDKERMGRLEGGGESIIWREKENGRNGGEMGEGKG
ncbi:hypothetical protein Tco_1254243 [Tanacetum coccineum]|uniref:Uncharacterized protein n=1 Tax=Tanacetum coccineum TaxID=301880 RepID=A0ABQ5GBT4_9ASTR